MTWLNNTYPSIPLAHHHSVYTPRPLPSASESARCHVAWGSDKHTYCTHFPPLHCGSWVILVSALASACRHLSSRCFDPLAEEREMFALAFDWKALSLLSSVFHSAHCEAWVVNSAVLSVKDHSENSEWRWLIHRETVWISETRLHRWAL